MAVQQTGGKSVNILSDPEQLSGNTIFPGCHTSVRITYVMWHI